MGDVKCTQTSRKKDVQHFLGFALPFYVQRSRKYHFLNTLINSLKYINNAKKDNEKNG